MTEQAITPRALDDNRLHLFKWVSGILAAVAVAWLIWVSNGTVDNAKSIAVIQANYVTIKESIDEIKATTKEIRQDQVRREKRDSR